MAIFDLLGGLGGAAFALVDIGAKARENAQIGHVYYVGPPPENPQPPLVTAPPGQGLGGLPSIIGVSLGAEASYGASPGLLPIDALPPAPAAPALPTVPASGGSAVAIPLPVAPLGPTGSSDPTLALARGGSFAAWWAPGDAEAAAYRKKLDAAARVIAKGTGITKRRKRAPMTMNKLGAKLAERAVKGLFKPGLGRAAAGTAARVGGKLLGPVAVGATMLPWDFLNDLRKSLGDVVFNPRGVPSPYGLARGKADELAPITVTAKRVGGVKRGGITTWPGIAQNQVMVPFPKYAPPAPAAKFGLKPAVVQRVQAVGALLDKLKKKGGSTVAAPLPIAALASIGAAAPLTNVSTFTNITSVGAVPKRGTAAAAACSCKPKRRGPARKCLERGQVIYKSGRYKGKAAGSKCIRYAT